MENSIPIPKRKPPEAFSLSPNAVNEKVKDFIRPHEDEVPYFYRDTKGNVTVGIGQMIPNEDKAKELPLYRYEGKKVLRPAKDEEKVEAFQRVKNAKEPLNTNHKKFDPREENEFINLQLQRPDQEFLFENHLRQNVKEIVKKFPDFETYPPSARKGIQDMQFNMGGNFNERGWDNFFSAARSRNWEKAAHESRRDLHKGDEKANEDDIRNQNTKRAFMDAIREDQRR